VKITGYRSLVLATPWRLLTYVILETDKGIEGVGEARVLNKTHTVLEYLKEAEKYFIGHDVHDIEELYKRFTLLDFGVAGEVVMTALALVEMACWDCIGKEARLPVYQLIGGKLQDTVPAYANGWYTVEREPEAFAEAAKRVVAKGYRAMKFDPFGSGNLELSREEFHRSIGLIEAVQDAVGDRAQLLIEMHGRFTPHQAIEIARAIEHLAPGWIEEPCRPDDLGALTMVARHTHLPIATGERLYSANQFRELFPLRCVNIIQPDLNQCGGLFETKKIASTAETYSVMVAPHNVGGIITTVATLHLMVGLRNGKILEHFNDFVDAFVKQAGTPYPEIVDGAFPLPQGPGWGVTLDEDFIKAHAAEVKNGVIQDKLPDLWRDDDWSMRGQGNV